MNETGELYTYTYTHTYIRIIMYTCIHQHVCIHVHNTRMYLATHGFCFISNRRNSEFRQRTMTGNAVSSSISMATRNGELEKMHTEHGYGGSEGNEDHSVCVCTCLNQVSVGK